MSISIEELTEHWRPARLIPTVGIRGQEEQERRATSSLLAVAHAVPEFGYALFGPLGAPKGRIQTFTEVQFKDAEGKTCIPDGVVVIERGRTRFTVLVEVKTGTAELEADQVSRYLEIARANEFAGVVTISNEITPSPADSPVAVDRRKLRSVKLWHLSWWRIITEAVMQHRFHGISDPDQAWILGELIAYLDHEASGASGFTDMGASWVRVRDAAHAGTLRAADPEAQAVCRRWEQFVEYLALRLSQDLGRDVAVARPRRQTAEQRLQAAVRQLADDGALLGSVKVPDAAAPLDLRADLRTRRVTASVTVDVPGEGRPLSRIKWLLRQIDQGADDLRVEVSFQGTRETTSLLLSEAREDPRLLLASSDPKRIPRTVTVAATRPLGTKRGKGRGSFVADARAQTVAFYRDIVQPITPWRAKAPQLAEEPDGFDGPTDSEPSLDPHGPPEPASSSGPIIGQGERSFRSVELGRVADHDEPGLSGPAEQRVLGQGETAVE